MAEIEYVRVKDNDTGHHLTIPRSRYDLDKSPYTELKSPALDAHGDPAPVKFHTAIAAPKTSGTTSAKSGQKAETEKE